jgi:hypothetical protein
LVPHLSKFKKLKLGLNEFTEVMSKNVVLLAVIILF